MRRIKAFTLVELLVVIGIIALLISILLPSLNRAREQARIIQCLSNLRQFAIGLRMYADSNRGQLVEPQLASDGSNAYPQTGRSTINTGTTYNPKATVLFHVGRLWQQRYLSAGRVAYCPANYDAPLFGWNAVGPTWPDASSVPGATAVRSDYMYMPHWKWLIGTPSRGYYKRLQEMPSTRMLASDLIRAQKYTSHKGSGSRATWNVVFPDGHAVSVTSAVVWRQLGSQGEYGNSGSDWNLLENYRDMLETLAAGRDLMDNPMGFAYTAGNNTAGRVWHKAGESGCGIGTMDGRKAVMP